MKLTLASVLHADAVTFVGAPGSAPGVAVAGFEGRPGPFALTAVTVNV